MFSRILKASLRTRLTALYGLVLGGVMLGFASVLYQAFVETQLEELDAALYNHAVDIARTIDLDFFGAFSINPDALSESGKVFPFALGKSFLQVRTISGTPIAKSRTLQGRELPFDDPARIEVLSRGAAFHSLRFTGQGETRFRLINFLIERQTPGNFVLQMAVPMTLLLNEQRRLLTFLWIAIPLALVIAGIGGWLISTWALSPIRTIIAKTRGMQASQLGTRLPVPDPEDEVRELALTLNGLLDRLQSAFESQERFIADASHQLRTPLSILRGELDVLRAQGESRKPGELEAFLDSASHEIDHLGRLVSQLLILARMDSGATALVIKTVRLDELLMDAVSRFTPLAQARGLRLSLNILDRTGGGDSAYEVQADPDLIHSAIQSLIENAVKYDQQPETAQKRPIEIVLREEEDRFVVDIRDRGPGVSDVDREKIFGRFHRGAAVRTEGVGLGLAIAKKIAEAHGGQLTLNRYEEGSVFSLGLRVSEAGIPLPSTRENRHPSI